MVLVATGPVSCRGAGSEAMLLVCFGSLVSLDSAHFLLRLEWAETARTPATASLREQTLVIHSAIKGTQTLRASGKSV